MTIAIEPNSLSKTQSSVPAAEPLRPQQIGIPKEIFGGERRVAVTPDTAKKLQKLGFEVLVESGAGDLANYSDAAYAAAGCRVLPTAAAVWQEADIVLKVRPPAIHPSGVAETSLLRQGGTLISFIWPAQNAELMAALAARQATVFAVDSVPRLSRAQKMDALSSMANIAGYRAVIEAANHFGRCFTGQITAAGKIPPARVLVIGAGVAGLAAIGTARSLGAVVKAFDTRPAVKEQVQSMGAEFLELHFQEDGTGSGGYSKEMSQAFIAAEMALFAQQAKEVDILITTALIPGKPAPLLITQEMVESMKPGSVIVDMAAEQGGNCEVTQPGEVCRHGGVTIVGLTDLPSRMAAQASQLYGTNLYHLLHDLGGAEAYCVNFEDEVIRGATVVRNGEITWPAPRLDAPTTSTVKPEAAAIAPADTTSPSTKPSLLPFVATALLTAALVAIGLWAPDSFLTHLMVFVLSVFLGWKVIWDVDPALHTPLMSVTNAISGIIIIGGMLQISSDWTSPVTILGAIAVLLGMINVAGGFMATQRMLNMFHR